MEERAVGRIVRAHGLRGELVVTPSTDNAAVRFAAGSVLGVRPQRRRPVAPSSPAVPPSLTVRAVRSHGDRLLVTVDEVGDRDAAEALRAATLVAEPLDDDPADADEYNDHQLEGCAVVLDDDTPVGVVREVLHGAGGELLVIDRTADAGGELLVPFVAAIVTRVDVADRRIVLDPPEGLLDPT